MFEIGDTVKVTGENLKAKGREGKVVDVISPDGDVYSVAFNDDKYSPFYGHELTLVKGRSLTVTKNESERNSDNLSFVSQRALLTAAAANGNIGMDELYDGLQYIDAMENAKPSYLKTGKIAQIKTIRRAMLEAQTKTDKGSLYVAKCIQEALVKEFGA